MQQRILGSTNHHLGKGSSIRKGIILAVNRVEFSSNWISYTTLRGHWCDTVVLNVNAPTEDKIDDTKGSFYEELECILDQFSQYDIKILLGDFNDEVWRKDIFKLTTGNESSGEINNDSEVRVVNFAT
jgi:hypothetical protein